MTPESAERELLKILGNCVSFNDIMNWHTKHSAPKVPTREQLEKIVGAQRSIQGGYVNPLFEWKNKIVDDLLALLNRTEKEKVWCEHIQWIQGCGAPSAYTGWAFYEKGRPEAHDLIDNWDICPVAGCHAPRPAHA